MRALVPLVVVLVALTGSWAGEKPAAPVPKEKPGLAIDGKYTLLSVSGSTGWGAAGGPKGGLGGKGTVVASGALVGPATITKNEIALEGRATAAALAGLVAVAPPTTMEYTLDPTNPGFIDVDTISLRGKKSKSLGLVEVNGNRLMIALAREGDERPKTTDEAENVTVYYFQKLPPAPRTEFRIVAMTLGKEAEAEKELNKLAESGFELVSTTQPVAADGKSSVTTIHFVLKRTVKQP